MATATVYCSTAAANGLVVAQGADYPPTNQSVAAVADANSAYQGIVGQWFESPAYYENQYFLSFDLSGYAASPSVSAATLSLYAEYNAPYENHTEEVYKFDWSGGGLTTADRRTPAQLTTLYAAAAGLFASYAWTSSTPTNAYSDFTSGSAILTDIAASCGSTLYLVVAVADNRTGTAPGAGNGERGLWYMASRGAGLYPRLVFTYTEAPSGFTGLTVIHPVG